MNSRECTSGIQTKEQRIRIFFNFTSTKKGNYFLIASIHQGNRQQMGPNLLPQKKKLTVTCLDYQTYGFSIDNSI